MLKRYPKMRGYRIARGSVSVVVNVGTLEKAFPANATINPQALEEKRIVRKEDGKIPQVKLLVRRIKVWVSARGRLKSSLPPGPPKVFWPSAA